MTSLILSNILAILYFWIAYWAGAAAFLMLRRPGNGAADYEIITTRAALSVVSACIVVRFILDHEYTPAPVTPWTIFIAAALTVLAYTTMMTTIRVVNTLEWEKKHDARSDITQH